ncbi:MAG: RNA polymerase sigma factor [Spirochaetes bacterium]|nr:RNA polymerase sigma factor [Spirochaetota bacterium]
MSGDGHPSDGLFQDLYASCGVMVYNLAYRMTGDAAAAEDITQETFLRAFAGYERFRGESAPSTWIYRIAKNLCLRHLRSASRGSFRSIEELIDAAGLGDSGAYDAGETDSYISQVREGCLLGLLRCLPFYQRIAFILSVLKDLPAAQVATILEKSENSVRLLVHRARKSLRGFLCKNCSLYSPGNRCRCENLISFSLARGWIDRCGPGADAESVAAELEMLEDEIALYRTLPERGGGLEGRIAGMIQNGEHRIFSRTKVK